MVYANKAWKMERLYIIALTYMQISDVKVLLPK